MDFAQLRAADPSTLGAVSQAWSAVATAMSTANTDATGAVWEPMASGDWTGQAADAAQTRAGELSDLIASGFAEASALKRIIADGQTRLTDAKAAMDGIVAEVQGSEELSIDAAGQVSVSLPPDLYPPDARPLAQALWTIHAAGYNERITTAVAEATAADVEVAQAIRFAADPTPGAWPTTRRSAPSRRTAPGSSIRCSDIWAKPSPPRPIPTTTPTWTPSGVTS